MTEERKNIIEEIQLHVSQADFDKAADLCKTYLQDNPNDLKVWWNYILADCRATSAKVLSARGVDLEQNAIFKQAVSALSEEKAQKLYEQARRIRPNKPHSDSSSSRDDCKRYFVQGINEVKAEIEATRAEIQDVVEAHKSVLDSIGKQGAKFYGNNVLGFVMLLAVVMIPFAVLAVLIRLAGASAFVSLIPVIVGLLLVVARVVIRLLRHKKFVKEFGNQRVSCAEMEARLDELNKEYKANLSRKKNMTKLYKSLTNSSSISEAQITKLKAKFDKIYLRQ